MTELMKDIRLPREHYQSFILKFMKDFVDHHNLHPHVVRIEGNMHLSQALSQIIDVMARSMGEERRKEILKELDEYNMSIPACFRD